MFVKLKFYNPQNGNLSRMSYTYESQVNVNVDDIVVVNSKFGLNFGIVTEILADSDYSQLNEILCVVPVEDEAYI